jgi:hypothetical protein
MNLFRCISILIVTFLLSLGAVAASDPNRVEIRGIPRKPTVAYSPATDAVNTVEVGETFGTIGGKAGSTCLNQTPR